MKTNNIVPPKKLALLAWAFCAGMLAFAQNASATRQPLPSTPTPTLAFNDTHVVGTITPASPADPGDVVNYVNFMIKTRLAELRFTRGLSYVSDGPAYAFCFGLHLRSVVHLAAITHRKNRIPPFWITRLQNAQTIRK